MNPISNAWAGLIDVTYYCGRKCVYCTRNDRHMGKKRYHMGLDQFHLALDSYDGWTKPIGIIGGDPLLHPQLDRLCDIMSRHPHEYMLFTSINPQTSKHKDILGFIFDLVHYHPHTDDQESQFTHQPLTIAIKDAVPDPNLRSLLINDCWLQRRWCPTITTDGAFFCETGASIAKLMGIKGWAVVPRWWKRNPDDFGYQKEICQMCGMAIPMQRQLMANHVEQISPSFLKMLQDHDLPVGPYELFDQEITVDEMKAALPTWTPGIYKTEQLQETFEWSTLDWGKL